jgi:hypothetical protein
MPSKETNAAYYKERRNKKKEQIKVEKTEEKFFICYENICLYFSRNSINKQELSEFKN